MPLKITNKLILKAIFMAKMNFRPGKAPSKKKFGFVEIAPFKNSAGAAMCISADFELNWAFRSSPEHIRNEHGKRTRENLPFLLKLFEDCEVPITWATVGHLFLEHCGRSSNGLAHAEMPRPPKNNRCKGDWYIQDPCTDVTRDPYFYCPDLITQIMRSSVKHEIGTHSFSHIDFSDEFSSRDLVSRELEECIKVMEPFGVKPTSLVFPHSALGYSYLDILAEKNITAVRHPVRTVLLSYPERTSQGIYKIYQTMNTRSARHYDYFDKAKIFLDRAFKTTSVFHLWFHPSDPLEIFTNEFRRIVEYAAKTRKERGLWIATMADIASYCEARESLKLDISKNGDKTRIFFKSSLDRRRYGTSDITLQFSDYALPSKAAYEVNGEMFPIDVSKIAPHKQERRFSITVPEKTSFIELAD